MTTTSATRFQPNETQRNGAMAQETNEIELGTARKTRVAIFGAGISRLAA